MTITTGHYSMMRWTPLVLVVDPGETERTLYGDQFRQVGFGVLEAVDSEEAIWLARDFAPDVICIDLVLPKIDGFTLVEQLKRTPMTAGIRVVAVTTMSYGAVLTHARAVGFDRVVTRPCPPDRLVKEIAELLGWPGGYRNPSGQWCRGTTRS